MIEMRELTIKQLVIKAQETMKKEHNQFVSYTKKVDFFQPLAIFGAAKQYTDKKRMFWKKHDDQYTLVGIGDMMNLTEEQEEKKAIYTKWREVVEQAITHNPYQESGVGLIAFGGMAFDPKKKSTELWRAFPEKEFRIPEFLFIKKNDNYYITINQWIDKHEAIDVRMEEWEQLERNLLKHQSYLPFTGEISEQKEIDTNKWKQAIEDAKMEISQKEVEKIVLARELRLRLSHSVDVTNVLHRLMDMQSNSYVFAYEKGLDCFVGATPEQLIQLEGRQMQSMCVAGTAPRGETEEQDERIKHGLLNDKKNREEHDYVVQMIRQSIEPFSEKIDIPNTPVIYPLKNLHHLYTPVTATLKKGHHLFQLIEKLHPTPALGGTPKELALQFIRKHESLDRGWYGAPIGWMDEKGNGEFAVAIRSALIQDKEASLFAGCGIVKDSDTEEEYAETRTKFLPMLSVLGGK